MITVGLTGPTGAGKGMLSTIFTKHGIPCLDTDKISRSVTQKGSPCLLELIQNFGGDILTPEGTLDRKKLANKVFLSEDKEEKTKLLNKITHKYILAEITNWLDEMLQMGVPCAVVDAPLLFEAGLDRDCDYVIAVLADTKTRIERIKARDGITRELAEKRISAQKSDEFFKEHCSIVFYNNGSNSDLEAAALPCISVLKSGELPK